MTEIDTVQNEALMRLLQVTESKGGRLRVETEVRAYVRENQTGCARCAPVWAPGTSEYRLK